MHALFSQSRKHHVFRKTAICRISLEKAFFEIITNFTPVQSDSQSYVIFSWDYLNQHQKLTNLEEKVFPCLKNLSFFRILACEFLVTRQVSNFIFIRNRGLMKLGTDASGCSLG